MLRDELTDNLDAASSLQFGLVFSFAAPPFPNLAPSPCSVGLFPLARLGQHSFSLSSIGASGGFARLLWPARSSSMQPSMHLHARVSPERRATARPMPSVRDATILLASAPGLVCDVAVRAARPYAHPERAFCEKVRSPIHRIAVIGSRSQGACSDYDWNGGISHSAPIERALSCIASMRAPSFRLAQATLDHPRRT